MLITPTPTLEVMRITRYLGIVTGEAILGANMITDLFAVIREMLRQANGVLMDSASGTAVIFEK
jgi:uncharacterized protein YbjQ (UPF0145 family)